MESLLMASPTSHFNPRSPHGERRGIIVDGVAYVTFQPTLPARGATSAADSFRTYGGDFNPRSPHGERPFRSR